MDALNIFGEIECVRPQQICAALERAGYAVNVSQYGTLRADIGEAHFRAEPIEGGVLFADADLDEAAARTLSGLFKAAGLRYRIEIYDDEDRLTGYLHHDWPLEETV